jgi:hypothetical protein
VTINGAVPEVGEAVKLTLEVATTFTVIPAVLEPLEFVAFIDTR